MMSVRLVRVKSRPGPGSGVDIRERTFLSLLASLLELSYTSHVLPVLPGVRRLSRRK